MRESAAEGAARRAAASAAAIRRQHGRSDDAQKRPLTPAEVPPKYGRHRQAAVALDRRTVAIARARAGRAARRRSFGAVSRRMRPAAPPTPATMKPTVEIVPIVL